LIEFASRAAAYPENEGAEICFVTFVRGSEAAENGFIREIRNRGLDVRVLGENGAFDFSVLRKIRETIRDFQPDIIQTHNVKSHFLVWLTREFRRYPWVAFQHGYTWTDLKMRLYNKLDRISLPSAHTVVTVCKPFADAMEKIGVQRDRIVIRHNSVQPFKASSPDVVADLRRKLSLSDETVVLLAVGRLSKEKGHADLLEALALLQQQAPAQKSALVVVGDGPERGNLQNLAAELGVGGKVIFAGQQADVSPYYSLADIVVLPSHTEGSPNVLLEAMSAGKAIVATAVGGVPEIAADGETALLVEPQEPAGFAKALEHLLRDAQLRKRLGSDAQDEARRYDPSNYCEAIVKLYGQALHQGAA
jgi:glycosyltransferase involved in cell wall biosynthesis